MERARTPLRDLVAASGANQASINYHFGSKEQLLTRSLRDLNTEWGELLFAVLEEPDDEEALWGRIIDSIQANRSLWFVNFESVASSRQDGEIRKMIASGQEVARASLARAFAGLGPGSDPDEVQAADSRYFALLAAQSPTPNMRLRPSSSSDPVAQSAAVCVGRGNDLPDGLLI
ncbi:TetR/AcrR family transcriptional regulator [Nonomuraea terrae]|uniref:TetR/AcrR family transcriptional regulator n=1 Tax=Nonomuraea terrae TaxID=2530383 RepID=UPI001CB6F10B|nr:TetR/AcrR family transcriptional regulator [Nonomuraea terrae]